MQADLEEVRRLAAAEHHLAVVATTRPTPGALHAGQRAGAAAPDDGGLPPREPRQLLRDVFTAAGGRHGDWDAYDATMAAERRTAVLVPPSRIYSNGPRAD